MFWLPGGRVFDGAWAEDRPLRGTAMEPGGALSLATFDGKTLLGDGTWDKATRAPAGRLLSDARPAQGGGGGPPPAWETRVARPGGGGLAGVFRGLRPHGAATLEEGGLTFAAEYDGARTIAEGPVPVRKEVRHSNRRIFFFLIFFK